uniref:Uncharacterized protein n=1 Tax=Anopheles maculatus TaxID=74869 RepID=A0A182T4R8_9DIPT
MFFIAETTDHHRLVHVPDSRVSAVTVWMLYARADGAPATTCAEHNTPDRREVPTHIRSIPGYRGPDLKTGEETLCLGAYASGRSTLQESVMKSAFQELAQPDTTTTTPPSSPPPPTATDVSYSLPTSLFPSTVPTVAAGSPIAENRFPLFLDQQTGSTAPDSDNDDRISTDEEDTLDQHHRDKAVDRSQNRRIGHRSAASPLSLNGTVTKKRCLRPPTPTSFELDGDGQPTVPECNASENGIDHEPEMTSTVAAVTAAANKAVAALMQYRQQQQQSQQPSPANVSTTTTFARFLHTLTNNSAYRVGNRSVTPAL